MAEFPAMPFWFDAYWLDCSHLTDAEHGRYLLIMKELWTAPRQRIPNDDEWLARRFRRPVEAVRSEIRPLLEEFCQCDGNWWTQKRLCEEFEYVTKRRQKQSDRAMSRWESADRKRANATTRSSRMAEARRKGTHTKEEWEALKQIFGACVRCGNTESRLEKDHIVPVYQGGSDGIENIQPTCARCNARKGPENVDHRSRYRPDWAAVFEATVGYNPLKPREAKACRGPAPTPSIESLSDLPSLDSVPSESETNTVPSAKPKTRRNEYPEAFQQFWLAYPRRSTDTKAAAFKAWDKQRKAGTDLSELHAGAERYAEYAARTGCETAHVQTWINRQGWTASYAIKGNGHAASTHRPSAEQEFWRRHAGPADVGADTPVAAYTPPRRG